MTTTETPADLLTLDLDVRKHCTFLNMFDIINSQVGHRIVCHYLDILGELTCI